MELKEKIAALIDDMKKDLNSSFPLFYELTKKPIYLNIYSYVKNPTESEDILQETYVKFLNGLQKISSSSSPLGLLYVISKNLSLDYLSKEGRTVSIDSFPDSDSYFPDESEQGSGSMEYYLYIKQIVSEKEYEIIVLHLAEGYSHKEIASELKMPLGSVTWAYNNGLKKIRKEEAKNEKRH